MIFAYYLFLLLYGFISTITMHTGDIFAYVNVNVVTTEMFYILTINYEIIDHHILMIDFTAHVPLRQAGVTCSHIVTCIFVVSYISSVHRCHGNT